MGVFHTQEKSVPFSFPKGQAGLRGEREPEGTRVRLELYEAQVNRMFAELWGFPDTGSNFRERAKAPIPKAERLIPKVKFLSRGDNKDTLYCPDKFQKGSWISEILCHLFKQ